MWQFILVNVFDFSVQYAFVSCRSKDRDKDGLSKQKVDSLHTNNDVERYYRCYNHHDWSLNVLKLILRRGR